MKKFYIVFISVILILALSVSIFACKENPDEPNIDPTIQNMSFSTVYSEVELKKSEKKWRDGMVGGNGKIGFITNGSPTSDVITYQNINYLMPTSADRDSFPSGGSSLETIRQKIVNGIEPDSTDIIGNWGRIAKYHPGMQLRIDTSYNGDIENYQRYTKYESGEVGENYSANGISWDRKTFSSRVDDVNITSITNSAKDVTLTISIDTISKMAGFGLGSDSGQADETNIQYKELVEDNGDYLAQVAHYPDYEHSAYKNGGFAAVSLIIIDGGTKEAIKASTSDSYNKSGYDAAVNIKNAKNVYIITALDKTKDMCTMLSFASQDSYNLLTNLLDQVKAVQNKYSSDIYTSALAPSASIQSELYNAATLNIIEEGDEEIEKSNNELIAAQKKSNSLSNVLANRVYNQGRYAMISCAGYTMSRLSGMWIGTWDPGWRYIYTMDANVNLQSSGMNTSNLSTFGDGYINFVYNQIEDWETNAKVIYNIDNAILCPPHADGERAINDEGNIEDNHSSLNSIGYPFKYWNAGAAWVIQPIYEYYQCYGNKTISTIDGDKELLKDILLPLLQKNANFWMGLCTPKYYTDANGNARYQEDKTALGANEKYLIIPSYSPENKTSGSYSSTLGVNATMDIASAKESLNMAIKIENLLKTTGYESRVNSYEDLLSKLPEYQYNSDGSIKEWCANGYNDNNTHRHLSHLYIAWPGFEMQGDEKLINAVKQALLDRDAASSADQNKQSHLWLHKGLVAARLKDSEAITNVLYTMLSKSALTSPFGTNGLLYNSLMTNHDITGSSNAYCTDSSLGLIGVINESLLYSTEGEIELLPAKPTTWAKGEYKNLRARTQANVSCSWSGTSVICTIKSDINQTIKVSYNGQSQNITFTAGETKTINF